MSNTVTAELTASSLSFADHVRSLAAHAMAIATMVELADPGILSGLEVSPCQMLRAQLLARAEAA